MVTLELIIVLSSPVCTLKREYLYLAVNVFFVLVNLG